MERITQERLAAITDVARRALEPTCHAPRRHGDGCKCKPPGNPLARAAMDMIAEIRAWREFGCLFEISRTGRNLKESNELMQNALKFAGEHRLFRDL